MLDVSSLCPMGNSVGVKRGWLRCGGRFNNRGGPVPQRTGSDAVDVDEVLGGYEGWLKRQPLAAGA